MRACEYIVSLPSVDIVIDHSISLSIIIMCFWCCVCCCIIHHIQMCFIHLFSSSQLHKKFVSICLYEIHLFHSDSMNDCFEILHTYSHQTYISSMLFRFIDERGKIIKKKKKLPTSDHNEWCDDNSHVKRLQIRMKKSQRANVLNKQVTGMANTRCPSDLSLELKCAHEIGAEMTLP